MYKKTYLDQINARFPRVQKEEKLIPSGKFEPFEMDHDQS